MTPLLRRLALLSLSLPLLAACHREAAEQAPAGGPPAKVTVVTLQPEPVTLTRELPGRTSPFLVAEVRPQVGGLVKERLFREGTVVKAGQPLYQLDDATYRAEIASARAAVTRAEAAFAAAKTRSARLTKLVKTGAVSAQDEETAVAELRQAEADVGVARAELQRRDVVLGHARIDAPITGRIGMSAVTQGALVTANQAEPMATVQQLDPIYVDLTQSSSEFLKLRRELAAGTLTSTRDVPVAILLEDGTRHAHDGKLAFADTSVDPETGSFLVRIEVPNPDHLLLPGMYVRAQIGMGQRADGLLVPQQGITRTPKGDATALVVAADGTVEQRTVQVDRTIGDRWLVESGLAAGDRVIVEGLQKVRPGAHVEAAERSDEARTASAPAQ